LKSSRETPASLVPEAGIEVNWPFYGETSYSLYDSTITLEWVEWVKMALNRARGK